MINKHTLSTHYLSAIPELCAHYKIDVCQLIEPLGVPLSSLHVSDDFMSHEQFNQLLNMGAITSGDALFSLELSLLFDLKSLDMAMLLMANQESIANFYPVLNRLYRTQNRASRHVIETKDTMARHSISFLFSDDVDVSQHALFSLCCIFNAFRYVLGDRLKLNRVFLKSFYNAEIQRLETFFGCPVSLNANFNGFEFPEKLLTEKPSLTIEASNNIRRKISSILEDNNDLVEIVTNCILLLMPFGDVSKTRTAKMLAVHPRTLQNLLKNKGYSYRQLLLSIRDSQAKSLLMDNNYSIQLISDMLCYSSAECFIRQFKLTNKITPLQYSLNNQ